MAISSISLPSKSRRAGEALIGGEADVTKGVPAHVTQIALNPQNQRESNQHTSLIGGS
jgi:hypothetical protein